MHKILKAMKKIKIKNLLILILILTFNTYAWFVYTTKVSLDLGVHVSSWDVQFVAKDGGISSLMEIKIENAYPGMEDFEETIEVKNRGEVNVNLSYEIKSIKIMDELIVPSEENGITSNDIEQKIKNEYPFKIEIQKDDSLLMQGQDDGMFRITVKWPFESGNDEKDTEWGEKAYEFYRNNSENDFIELKLLLKAEQTKE